MESDFSAHNNASDKILHLVGENEGLSNNLYSRCWLRFLSSDDSCAASEVSIM